VYRLLKAARVVISLGIFVLILICFVDVYRLTNQWAVGLLKWQLVPALLGAAAGTAAILACLLALTLAFGRVYCSTLCPLGVYQDIVRRISNLFRSKKQRRLKYGKPHHLVRYLTLGAVVVFCILGSSTLLLTLDPYSNFGRMAANLLQPVIIWCGNILSDVFPSVPYQDFRIFTAGTCLFAAIVLVVITVLSAFRGRLYCNTVCPVGSLLGLFSRYALFRFSFDNEACTRCAICVRKCKGQCIDVSAQSVDASRCVQCYNCVTACASKGIRYRFAYKKKRTTVQKKDIVRRRLFIGTLGGIAVAGVTRAFTRPWHTSTSNTKALTPPGSRSLDRFKLYCTACHACVAGCPSKVLRPAVNEYGMDGLMLPVMNYNASFCNYECNVCSQICPNGAITPLTKEEKALTQIGTARFTAERCVVTLNETDCGACDEHCPVKAIRMTPFRDGLLIPQVDTSICIGCGGCEYICPARPEKAIQVMANAVHQTAQPITDDTQDKVEVNDFGF
jgi:ferredoxin